MNRVNIADWPQDQLEYLGRCPVCGSGKRQSEHQGLTDVTFSVALGTWTLWQCTQCRSEYLDPRPDAQSIGDAYAAYYTHATIIPTEPSNTVRSRLANDYRNWRFGSRLSPSLAIGRYVVRLNRTLQRQTEAHFRYLPKRPPGGRRTLLDFGCGNGEFLQRATSIGWASYGVEPDQAARRVARSAGFDVRPDIASFRSDGMIFQAVTLSHVIEHLHDPAITLRQLHRLMARGATLYVETPNAGAVGHQIYGRHWRGLEIPRHLVLFSRHGLAAALSRSGFTGLKFHPCPDALPFTAVQSRRIAAKEDPYGTSSGMGRWPTPQEYSLAEQPGEHSEFLIVTATKIHK